MAINKKALLIILIIALLLGAVLYLLKYFGKEITLDFLERESPKTLGEKIYQGLQNPGEKIPQTNPFKAKINVFEELKLNPFE